MSTANHGGATVPAESFELDLDLHGFETEESAPARVEGDLVRDMNGAFTLEFQSAEQRWRVELQPNPRTGSLKAVGAFESESGSGRGGVLAHEKDDTQPDIEELDQWLRFVIRHVSSEVEA